jgi:pimeloyl-ACP methyl ester carboxylesterase
VRRLLWSSLWFLIGFAILFHLAGGWYFSNQLIDEAFVPNPDPYVVPQGDYQLEEITYETPLGQMDALYLPASGATWVIHVHGKGTTPSEAEPLFSALQAAGYPQLSITYRNDDTEPSDPSGYYQYGITEWEDVNGAVDYALANGARSIVLSGFSTGTAHVMSFMLNRSLDSIVGVLMDSPNIDLAAAVELGASKRNLPLIPVSVPGSLVAAAEFISSLRMGVNWKSVDYVSKADLIIKQPVLIHHGTDDQRVPISVSVTLAEARPDAVRLIEVDGAGHVESYEANPQKYVDDVLSFLSQVG